MSADAKIALIFLFLFSSALTFPAIAQIADRDSLPPPSYNNSTIGFRQKFNIYVWHYNLNTTRMVTNRWTFRLSEQFRSSMLSLGSLGDKWKDDQNLQFGVDYLCLPALTLKTELSSVIYRDRQSGFNNDVRTHLGRLGMEFTPLPTVMASLQAGPKFDTRFHQNDTGLNYSFQLTALNVRYEDYDNSLNVLLGQDRFAQRRNGDLAAHYILRREFAPGTSDSLHIFTTNQRRDNYASFEGDIESLRERQNGFENRLLYSVAPGIRFNFFSELMFKNVHVLSSSEELTQKERRRNDQRFNNELGLSVKRRNLNGRVMLSYWSQTQRYDIDVGDNRIPFSKRTAFVTPDNESSRLSLSAIVGTRLSRVDSLYSYFSVNRYQYDTPDTNNFDDRDELRINGRLTAIHHFSEMLKVDIQASVNLFHMVYIYGERSADNNWNRIFRLRPGIHIYPSDRLRFSQLFEVLANYVDYDFNDEFSLTKSFVFRKFAMDDSLRLQITDRTRLQLDYRLQLEENGQLNWEEWTERVLATRQNQWFHIRWHYHIADKFVLAPGYTFYRRDEWRHSADQFGVERRERQGAHISHGPVLRLYYRPSRRIRLIFDGVRYAVKPAAGAEYFTNNLELVMNLYL